jgi:hypothetical protein
LPLVPVSASSGFFQKRLPNSISLISSLPEVNAA